MKSILKRTLLLLLFWLFTVPINAQNNPINGLYVDLPGAPTILNDGTSANTFVVSVTNFNLSQAEPTVVLSETDNISIRFLTDPRQASENSLRSWALATVHQLNACTISVFSSTNKNVTADWDIDKYPGPGAADSDGLSGWTLTPKSTITIKPNESFYIRIEELITNTPSGPALGYYQIDSKGSTLKNKFGPLNKGRVVEQQGRIGINTTSPGAALDVNGDIAGNGGLSLANTILVKNGGMLVKGGAPGAYNQNKTGYFFGSPGDNDSGMSSSADGSLEFYTNSNEAVKLTHNGTAIQASVRGALKVEGRIKDKTGDVMPVGSIIAYGGSNAPEGWLVCDGRVLPVRTEYADLRTIVGDKVPDLRSRFIVGAGVGSGLSAYAVSATGGKETHTLTLEEMPSHNHLFNPQGYYSFGKAEKGWESKGSGREVISEDAGEITSGRKTPKDFPNVIVPTGGRKKGADWHGVTQPHENRPPYYALTYIIKY